MKFINLTKNPVTVFKKNGGQITFEPEQNPAQCKITQKVVDNFDGIEVVVLRYSDLSVDLPAQKEGVGYIVSKVAAECILMCEDRDDLFVPCLQVRDGGTILGCRCLEMAG